ncbi:hypothetical protein ABDD95_05245 [Mucilaginibacter sp. PAMB04274]|uniref:hypothetical protein n=1 Tax=Mucilaginibacter sp. PAMB04274 TaxID=3138568 RepID=UPI0031F639EA
MTKKIYGVLLLVTILFASGCKTDPAVVPDSLQNLKLLGKWFLTDFEITTQVDADAPTTVNLTDFTDKDYFEFKTDNQATYSSTLYGRVFEGYYSANSSTTPQTLSFKSGNLLLKYQVESIDTLQFVIYETTTSTVGGVTTTITNRYTYSRIP